MRAPSLARMAIAKVEPLLTTRSVRGPFDYRLPESMEEVEVGRSWSSRSAAAGSRAWSSRLAETSDLPAERLAEPFEALEAGVPPELVELGRWVGEEYCSTPSRGLGLVLPPGTGTGAEARRVRPLVELEVERPRPGERALAEGERLGPAPAARCCAALAAGPKLGQGARRRPPAPTAPTIRRLEAARPGRDARGRAPPPARRSPRWGASRGAVELNAGPARRRRRDRARRCGHGGEWLLHGVTGSGKTEVYLAAAAAALDRGHGRRSCWSPRSR